MAGHLALKKWLDILNASENDLLHFYSGTKFALVV